MCFELLDYPRLRHLFKVLLLWLACGFWSQASGQVAISLAAGSGTPGSTINLNISVTTTGALPASLQWTMTYASGNLSSIVVTPGSAATAAGKVVSCAGVGTITCILFGINTATISNGVVAVAAVTVAPGNVSNSSPIGLSGVVASDASGISLSANGTGNTVTVVQSALLSVTVATNPAGLQIVVDNNQTFTAPRTFQWAAGSQHTIGTLSPQGSGGTRYLFSNWSDGGGQSHTITASPGSVTFTATFTTQHRLTTSVSPFNSGSIQVLPLSPDGFYNIGTVIHLTALPSAGYQFNSWIGTASTANPGSAVLNSPLAVSAHFDASSGACTYSLSRSSFAASGEGDFGRAEVTTGESCNWTASSDSSWITFNGSNTGSGQGNVGFTVAGNPGFAARSGTVNIGGQSLTVTQAGASCGSDIVVSNAVMPALNSNSQNLLLNVVAPAGCQWSIAAAPAWGTLGSASEAMGTGSRNVLVTLSSNDTPNPRLGFFQVGGFGVPVMQVGTTIPQLYTDVPPSNVFVHNINLLWLNNIRIGCTATEFCPDLEASRAETAQMVISTLLGENFSFPQTPFFTDVPSSHPFFKYIQKLRELGITVGCTLTTYCPSSLVTRGQMATFMIRARLRAANTNVTEPPYPGEPFFQDVPGDHIFFPYIQKLKQVGITAGCSETGFCPDLQTTRGQLAAFVTKALLAP